MHIILHIGLRKTGTTSIQKFLNNNYHVLLDHNILYPRSGLPVRGSSYAHHDLASFTTGIKSPTNALCWEQMHEELSHHTDKLVFISSEIFSVATQQKIEEIRKNLAGHQVVVLIYLREPVSFMISLYKEQIKAHNGCGTFNKFSRKFFYLTDYECLIKNWQLIFGDSNIILKNYDDLASGDLLINNLLESLYLDNCSTEFSFNDKANVSPDDKVVIMIRYFNFVKNKFYLPLSFRNKIQDNIKDLTRLNNHGKLLLRRYSRFLPKEMITQHAIKTLEAKIRLFSHDYRENFQNHARLIDPNIK
jgi:hypothetical protein